MTITLKEPFKSDFKYFDGEDYQDKDQYVDELWKNIILKFSSWNIVTSSSENLEEAFSKWLLLFTNILDETYDRYTKTLELYDREKSDLLRKLETVSSGVTYGENERRYNDTPQTGSDGIESDNYLTDYTRNNDKNKTKTKSAYDPSTIMRRLDEISRLYRDTLAEWTREFSPLFWPAE